MRRVFQFIVVIVCTVPAWVAVGLLLWPLHLSATGVQQVINTPAPTSGAVLATDTFTRADQNPISGNWTTCSGQGGLRLLTTAIAHIDSGTDGCIYYNAVTPNNDQYSQAVMTRGSDTTAGNGSGMCVTVRQATGANSLYDVCVNAAATLNVTLAKRVTGSYTAIWSRTATFADGDILKLSVTGTTLKVFVNGVQVGADSTDSALTSGRCGIAYSSNSVGATADSWECGNN
jgi:hypothetical protein